MTKMKRSEFKALVKECVRECIKEIMQEQINPVGLQEMFQARPQIPAMAGLVNPMDDHQMRLRQEILAQRGLIQNQMQRQQAMHLNPMQQQVGGMAELAGLSAGGGEEPASPSRYMNSSTGYTNPSDRLRFADQRPMRNGYDPRLDAGPQQQQREPERRILRLDPSLDTPIGGGDIRPPDPNILKGIFEDTMRTTYMQQQVAEKQGPVADRYAMQVANHAPDELFAGSQNWAQLAFSSK